MVSGPSQSSETEPYRSPEQLQNKIDSLQIRQSFYQAALSFSPDTRATVLIAAGKSKDGGIHFLFLNTGDNFPSIGV